MHNAFNLKYTSQSMHGEDINYVQMLNTNICIQASLKNKFNMPFRLFTNLMHGIALTYITGCASNYLSEGIFLRVWMVHFDTSEKMYHMKDRFKI